MNLLMHTISPPVLPSITSVGSMLEADPLTIEGNAKLSQLIALLSEVRQGNPASCVFVMNSVIGRVEPIGVVTAWNIVQLAASGLSTNDLTVKDIVAPIKFTLLDSELDEPLKVLSILHQEKINYLPIVDDTGGWVGLVTPSSIQKMISPSNLLKIYRVSDAMNTQVIHSSLNATVLQVAQLMVQHSVDCVVIVGGTIEQGLIPLGMVTARDIVCLQNQGSTLAAVSVQTLMQTPLPCLAATDSLWVAHEEMRQHQVTCLVVTDKQDKMLGILTQIELSRALAPSEMHKSMGYLQKVIRQLEIEKLSLLQNQNAELERLVQARTMQLEEQAKGDRLLAATTLRIHQSLSLEEILSTTVSEVQQLLQTDRTIIYRLNPDGSGVVVVESVKPEWMSMQGKTIHDSVFADRYRDVYLKEQFQVTEDIYKADMAQCHIDMLAHFQIRANLVLPIVCGQQLWGLLATQHCAKPYCWNDREIQLLKHLVKQVGIALHQSELYEQAQMELKQRQRVESELSRLFNLSLDMVCVAGLDGYFKRLNPAFTRTLGYTEQELLAIPFIECVHPDDRQATLAAVGTLADGQALNYLENRYRCKDGSYRWLAWTSVPDDPIQQLVYAIARDITQQKEAELLLKQSNDELEAKVEERTASWRQANESLLVEFAERNHVENDLRKAKDQLHAVLDTVPGLISWVGKDLCYLGVNRHVATAFNTTVESFTEQPIGFLKENSQFSDFFQQFFAKPLQTDTQEITVEIDGANRSYLMMAQKYDDDQAAVSVGIDISDRKQVESALQESEAKFRNLVEQTNDWVWETDCDLRFIYLNPRVAEITGYTSEEVLTKQIFEFMSVDEALRCSTVLRHFIQKNESFSQLETTILHKAGHPVGLEISGSPVFSAQGTLQGYRGITRDITERKQVERNIRIALTKQKELNELKTRFISMASHEFRTPLTTILASAESLERYQFKWTDDQKKSTLQRIQTAVKYMTDLLNDVLVFGKGEAGKLEFNPSLLNLEHLCACLVEEFQFKENNPQRLLFIQSGDSTDGWADEKMLRHILVNLLANALKYSPPETSVRLELACRDGTATFRVQDTGIGIPVNEQKRLFDSFYRATNVGNIPGTGLGLAIVMRAIKAHRGTITVTSEAGIGTTFTVSLPITEVKLNP